LLDLIILGRIATTRKDVSDITYYLGIVFLKVIMGELIIILCGETECKQLVKK